SRALVEGETAARAVVVRRAPGGARRGAPLLKFGVGAEAGIGQALRHQPVGALAVQVQTLTLTVRPQRATAVGALVIVEAEPREIVEHPGLTLLARARDVGILDPHDEAATVLAREQPVEVGGAGAADVEPAGRARGKAHTHVGVGARGHGPCEASRSRG